jgi:hypothetical protein
MVTRHFSQHHTTQNPKETHMGTMSAAGIRSLYRTFPRTQYGMLSLGSQQHEPQKPRRRPLLTSASALPSAARWQRPDWADSPFAATSQLQLQETTPMQKTLLIGYLGKDPEMKYTADGVVFPFPT